jgi:vancomycin resistance protein YoaR
VAEGEAFAEQALGAPVTISFQGAGVDVTPEQYARALQLQPEGGALVPHLRPRALHHVLEGLVSPSGQAPVDATVRLRGETPEVVPAKPGVTYDAAQVDAAFLDLVTQPEGQRTLEVQSSVAEPAVTTEDAEAWQITEQVSEFTTYFPYAEYRNVNIGRAAELVDGTVVPPGETFSLNDTVGERTAENGFTDGFIISNGIFKEDLGGGVSQMATTTFNAAFFAGMTDVEHKPHSFYIDRYPVGREATVAWPVVDLKFRNDTPYGVLVHAVLQDSTPSSQGELTVSTYSTKYWDITSRTSDRYNYTSPATRTLDTPDCYANTGYGGFDVDVWRYWRKAGSDDLERTEKMHTTYTPSDTVVCKPPGSLSGPGGNGNGNQGG